MFSHNGAKKPESKTKRMFRAFRQLAALGAKSAVSVYIKHYVCVKYICQCFALISYGCESVFRAQLTYRPTCASCVQL